MIPAAMLMISKVLAIMINISRFICTFVTLSRGSGQRRGTSRKRSKADKGRLILACKFDLSRVQSLMIPLYFFFGFVLGSLWVWCVVAFVKRC